MDEIAGAVLTGGASRRMGRDKALITRGGLPLAVRVRDALRSAGVERVACIGGDERSLRLHGLEFVPDERPGAGPLSGVVTALAAQDAAVVVVLACDLVDPSPAAIQETVAALLEDPAAAVAVPSSEGRLQWTHAAWRRALALGPLRTALEAGSRSFGEAIAGLQVKVVRGLGTESLRDADFPSELPGETDPL